MPIFYFSSIESQQKILFPGNSITIGIVVPILSRDPLIKQMRGGELRGKVYCSIRILLWDRKKFPSNQI